MYSSLGTLIEVSCGRRSAANLKTADHASQTRFVTSRLGRRVFRFALTATSSLTPPVPHLTIRGGLRASTLRT